MWNVSSAESWFPRLVFLGQGVQCFVYKQRQDDYDQKRLVIKLRIWKSLDEPVKCVVCVRVQGTPKKYSQAL